MLSIGEVHLKTWHVHLRTEDVSPTLEIQRKGPRITVWLLKQAASQSRSQEALMLETVAAGSAVTVPTSAHKLAAPPRPPHLP